MNMKLFDYQEEWWDGLGGLLESTNPSWFKCRRERGKRICLQQ